MAVTVKIPAQLRALTGNESEAAGRGRLGRRGARRRVRALRGLRDRITENGELRRFVNVYVGGEDIRFGQGLDTPVERRRRDHDPARRRRWVMTPLSPR